MSVATWARPAQVTRANVERVLLTVATVGQRGALTVAKMKRGKWQWPFLAFTLVVSTALSGSRIGLDAGCRVSVSSMVCPAWLRF